MNDIGEFPGIETLSPELQAAIEQTASVTGLAIRRRCAMPELARVGPMCIWRHRPVTASISGELPGLGEDQVRGLYQQALTIWNQACNVGLVWTDSIGSANIWANCKKIDGASGTLAWSYLPSCGGNSQTMRLEQRYDTSERWSRDWFLEVVLHELGHAIGLDHDTNKGALLYPYSAGGKILKPTQYEIARVVPAYGPPVVSPPAGIPVIGGGMLFVDGGVAVSVDAQAGFDYGGRRYRLEVK